MRYLMLSAAVMAGLALRTVHLKPQPTYVPLYAPPLAFQAPQRGVAVAAANEVVPDSPWTKSASERLKTFDFRALRRALFDLSRSGNYPQGPQFLKRLDEAEKAVADLPAADAARLTELQKQLEALKSEALLANPLLNFEKLLLVKRGAAKLGLPQNWQGNCAIARDGYDNELATMSPQGGALTTLFKPEKGKFVGDVDLHWDGDRMLFSMPGSNNRWQIWEMRADASGLRQVTPGAEPDVDNYDACYLPDGRIIFDSTRAFQGVPCVGGGNTVANLCLQSADGKTTRQLCFDQDHDWTPAILNNGRVLYTRWEYTDTPHYFTRLLFSMNPDGTNQAAYYGSNSYWPNSLFYARAVPNHPTKVVGIVSGHHGVPRMGELVVFDPARGRDEANGAVQKIPGYGKTVEPVITDQLVANAWPKFLHPYPLSDKYFLVSCQPNAKANWGIYLVDTFDNMLLLAEQPGYALLEPTPLRKSVRPPVIPDKVKPDRNDATVYMADVYTGPGLKGVPRGTVKALRVMEYHYAYPRMGGHINIGIDGPWDVHRILGTVPVYEDGSANFKVPANIPLAVQPLDAQGRAVQVMRSWYTAMPGEVVTCVGCHENVNTAPPKRITIASRRAAVEITPWHGAARGFDFKREVQPVLDRLCVGCHDGAEADRPDFRRQAKNGSGNFTPAYIALHPYVRRPGPESDYHLPNPYEYHASTSELVQLLEKGHHGVQLSAEDWDRLYTWIDLNVPDHGSWGEHRAIAGDLRERRVAMRACYAGRPEDPEILPEIPPQPEFQAPRARPQRGAAAPKLAAWPLDTAAAKQLQSSAGPPAELKINLAPGVDLELVLVPAGEFAMGEAHGAADEAPLSKVVIEKPFYAGRFEITNQQFRLFDSSRDLDFISEFNKDHTTRGVPAHLPNFPAIRVSWSEAMAYCKWLTAKTGRAFTLPTEAQWEWACRAGTTTPLWYGEPGDNFAKFANLADTRLKELTIRDSPKWIPRVDTVDDGAIGPDAANKRAANAFGLQGTHGNAAEWTLSLYKPYPYSEGDGRNDAQASGFRVLRGGSFYDRPQRARSAFRLAYPPFQRVYNAGFRVICPVENAPLRQARR